MSIFKGRFAKLVPVVWQAIERKDNVTGKWARANTGQTIDKVLNTSVQWKVESGTFFLSSLSTRGHRWQLLLVLQRPCALKAKRERAVPETKTGPAVTHSRDLLDLVSLFAFAFLIYSVFLHQRHLQTCFTCQKSFPSSLLNTPLLIDRTRQNCAPV